MVNTEQTSQDPAGEEATPRGSLFAKILVGLFLLPFCLIGLLTGYNGLKSIAEGKWEDGGFMLIFAVVFGGVGFGGVAAALYFSRKKKREDLRKTRYADTPWMLREDWATGIIKSNAKSLLIFFLIFTVGWNLVSLPLVFFLPEEVEKGNTAALIGFIFPLVGLILLAVTIRMFLARRKFGVTRFVMSTIPGVIGGEVAGSVEVGRVLAGKVLVRLSNVRRVTTGSGKNSSTNETVLWQDECPGTVREPLPDRPGERFPVRFRVPFECKPTDESDSRDQIVWRLEAMSEEPGIDFSATFDVPVFKTSRSSPALTETKIERERTESVPGALAPEPPPGLEVRPGAEGGTEYVLHAKGNLKGSLGLGAFMIIWTGVIVLMVIGEAPLIFPLVFGLFDLLLLAGLVMMNFLTSVVLVEREAVTVRHRVLGLMFGTRMPRSTIAAVKVVNNGQSGKTSYWTVAFEQTGGKGARLWHMLDQRRFAEWLAKEIRKALRID